jgi:hypothetical protein
MMKKYCCILFCLIVLSIRIQAQCFCSEISFRILLKDKVSLNGESNYSIKIVSPKSLSGKIDRKIYRNEINGDSTKFQIPTGGGIDTLVFLINNLSEKTEMKVTNLHMTYDNPYFIDLTSFRPGSFLFDWQKIDKCQKENISKEFVECDKQKFYQLELVNAKDIYWPNGFVHNKIRPQELDFFKITN